MRTQQKQATFKKTVTKRENSPKNSMNRNNSLKVSRNAQRITFMFLGLIGTIILLPTFIVIPFLDTKEEYERDSYEKSVEDAEETDSSLFVSVMRSHSDEVERIPIETYVARVLASEMPVDFEMEALKAQALAARTYIVNHLMHLESSDTEISDTTTHQVYKNDQELRELWGSSYHENMEKLNTAVEATKGHIITYDNSPITAAYFSTANGYTENSEDYWEQEIPYLRSVESPWDEESPMFLDQITFTIQEIEEALAISLPKSTFLSIEITRTFSNRVKEFTIEGKTFTGRDIREKLSLKSNDFTVKQRDHYLTFTTKGYGHGVGMSQYGANGMAKEGKTYDEIIKYYYQDVEIQTIDDIAPKLVSKE